MNAKISKRRETVRKNPHAFLLNCCIQRALRPHAEFVAGGRGIIVLITPEEGILADFTVAALCELIQDDDDIRSGTYGYMKIKKGYPPNKTDDDYESEIHEKARAFIITESKEDLTPKILLAADHILEVPAATAKDVVLTFNEVLGVEITEMTAIEILRYKWQHLWTAARPGRPAADVLRRLASTISGANAGQTGPLRVEEAPRLEKLYGYGPAKDWGLQLRDDLRAWGDGQLAWADVDRGLLLSGAPGTGKTTFAAALANTCDVHLIATSMAKWQARGHLGDMLKAMRADFNSAKQNAPCILFIDEIDSVGDRAKFKHDYADYSIQVVNGLLECIDGNEGREGVIVIGSTNYPDKIDPAVRRSGRLDKHVSIPLPDGDARVAILSHYLQYELSEHELDSLRPLTVDFSGADLARLVRDGRRVARREGRSITVDDLRDQLPTLHPVVGVYRESIAIHEAGHTIVGHLLGYGRFIGVNIARGINPDMQKNVGGASFEVPRFGFHYRQTYLDKIAVGLAGIAAETLKLRAFGDGASAGRHSDLAIATQTASYIEGQAGWGATFSYSEVCDVDYELALQANPGLRTAVNKVLDEQFQRATSMLRENLELLDMISAELVATGHVGPEKLEEYILKIEGGKATKKRRRIH